MEPVQPIEPTKSIPHGEPGAGQLVCGKLIRLSSAWLSIIGTTGSEAGTGDLDSLFRVSRAYAIAAESPGNGISKPILLEMATRSALVLQNCMAGALGAKIEDDRMKSNAIFRFGVGYPLRAAYGFAMFQRTAPEFARSASVAAFLVPALVLVVAIVWRKPLLYSSKADLHWVAIRWLALLPTLILLAQVFVYGLVRPVMMVLLLPLLGLLATLGLIETNVVHWQKYGGWIGDTLSFLVAYSTAVWVGVGPPSDCDSRFAPSDASCGTFCSSSLGAKFRSWIQDRREHRKLGSAAVQSPTSPGADQQGSMHT